MRLIYKYKIKNSGNLLFAKIDIKNYLKRKNYFVDFFTFAVMELGTNIIKYPKEGEIWLLEEDGEYILCALDRGDGIKRIEWVRQKGTTTSKNSLGLGLYQLSQNDYFELLIFSMNKKNINGSVFMLKPKKLKKKYVVFSNNYLDMDVGGDFFEKKGRFFLIGDASGHGIKANKSAEFIKRYFMRNRISCIVIDDFFKNLDLELKKHSLRGSAVSVIEKLDNKITCCGVGNIGFMIKKNDIKYTSQKEGIIGEVFSRISKYEFDFDKNSIFLSFSDGIDEKVLYNILQKHDNEYLLAVSAVYFSKRMDDKIILVIRS